MKCWKKLLPPALALLLALNLTACGGDTQSNSGTPGNTTEPVTDMAFLDGMWSIDGLTKLYFDSGEGCYVYRSYYGLGGRGEFSEVDGRPMITFNGFLYDFLLRDDGVLLPNQNGDGDGLTIDHHTFLRDEEAEFTVWEPENYDGLWQNAAGETIVINTSLMQYIACSPDYSAVGTINDEGEGMGLYLYDNGGRAYLCPDGSGDSFTLKGEYGGRYSDDGHFDGVFYRDGDIDAFTDLSEAEFYYGKGSETWLWYSDGVNDYFLGDDYEIGDDGLAYHIEDGSVYPAGWIPDERYDPAVNWGEDWMDNWDI